jgi:hypothetical protein
MLIVSEEKILKNRPIRNKNCLWWPCLLLDRDKMSTLYRGPSIDASYQVLVHLAKGFQRRRLKCEKLTDDDKSSHCLFFLFRSNNQFTTEDSDKDKFLSECILHFYFKPRTNWSWIFMKYLLDISNQLSTKLWTISFFFLKQFFFSSK